MSAHGVFVTRPGDGEVLAVQDFEPGDPGPGQVRVDVAAAGVNFLDVYKRQGVYPGPTPFLLGEEGAGIVTAVGPDVTELAVGSRVAWAMSSGSMATSVIKPVAALVPVPGGIGLDTAAAAMLQGLTAHYLVRSTYVIQAGNVALVHAAAGGVGQLLVQMITNLDATVVATAGSAEKLEIARGRGAEHLINYRQYDTPESLAEAVRAAAGRGVDVVYDGVGASTFEASLRSLRKRGMMVLFGGASGQVPPFDLQRLNAFGSLYATRPSLAHYIDEREEFEWRAAELFSAIGDGSLQIDIGARYPMDEAAAAYAALEGRASTGKLIIEIAG